MSIPWDPMDGRMTAIQDITSSTRPQDGRSFAVERFHEAPQHYLKAGRGGRRDSSEPYTSMRYNVCTYIYIIIYCICFMFFFFDLFNRTSFWGPLFFSCQVSFSGCRCFIPTKCNFAIEKVLSSHFW